MVQSSQPLRAKYITQKGASFTLTKDLQGSLKYQQGRAIQILGDLSFERANTMAEKVSFKDPNRWHCLIKRTQAV